jgi:hypothetical protein
LLAVVAFAAITACRPPAADPMAAFSSERHPGYQLPFNTVSILDRALARTIVAEQSGARRTPTNTLVAWAILRNRSDDGVKVSVRTRFYDANRQPLEESAWTLVHIERRGLRSYEVPAVRREAAFYHIEVMEGR